MPNSEYSLPSTLYKVWFTGSGSIIVVYREWIPDGSIIVANKRCKNLKELLAREDLYDVREDLTQNVVYLAYCTKCGLQGVGSTVKWKARLANYKSHIKKRIKKPCRIVKHFMNTCVDPDIPHKYLRFIVIDSVNNTEGLEEEEADALLIEKEQFWIGNLRTYPFGLNSAHDLHRKTGKNIPGD